MKHNLSYKTYFFSFYFLFSSVGKLYKITYVHKLRLITFVYMLGFIAFVFLSFSLSYKLTHSFGFNNFRVFKFWYKL
jgi:hypothetical protein